MSSAWVDAQSGSDSNDGLTLATPKQTLAAGAALLDATTYETLYLKGTFRAAGLTLASLQNKNVSAWPGQSRWTIRGDTVLATTGWSASSNGYAKNIGTGKTLSAVVYNWDNCVLASGRHYGILFSDSLANVQGATDSVGRYNYNSGTGVLTVYVPGSTVATTSDNPATSGKDLAICETEGLNAVLLDGCVNVTVEDGYCYLFPTYTNQDGWGVQVKSSNNCIVRRVNAIDCGAHGIGAYGSGASSTGLLVQNCTMHGLRPDSTHAVNYQDSAYEPLTGDYLGCTIRVGRWLGTDGNVLTHRPYSTVTATAMGANLQIPFYAHSNGGTAAISKVRVRQCSIVYDEACEGSAEAANGTKPSVGAAPSAYPVEVSDCTFAGCGPLVWASGLVSFVRCKFQQTRQLPEGGGQKGAFNFGFDGGSSSRDVCFHATEFRWNSSDASAGAALTRAFANAVAGGTSEMRLVNCSILDTSTQTLTNLHGIFDMQGSSSVLYRVNGSILAYTSTQALNSLTINDIGLASSAYAFNDNRYQNIGASRWASQNTSFDTFAEWLASIDTAAAQVSGTIFPSPSVSLDIKGGVLAGVMRTTSSPVPTALIDGPYDGSYGAYTYSTASAAGSRSRSFVRDRGWGVR